ncbi:hypothetical protein BKA80DRAFT_125628 [Phyllosticta citrichinensis]
MATGARCLLQRPATGDCCPLRRTATRTRHPLRRKAATAIADATQILRDHGEISFDEPRLGCPRDHATGFREYREHEKANTLNTVKKFTANIKAQQLHAIQELEKRQSKKMTEVQQAHARDVQEIKNSIVALGLSLQEAPRSSPSAFAETCNQSSSTSGNKSAPSTFAQSGNQSSSTFSTTGNKSVSSTFANSGNRSTPSTFEEAGTNSSSSFGEAGNKSSSTFAEVGKKEPEVCQSFCHPN